ncbi:MAG: hypothetical protein DRO00_01620 [Thermoproteota archaeon]|nr:MAG: hypothetical protein DRO00_01620 [Candidatus Korarchaeota archaeon]
MAVDLKMIEDMLEDLPDNVAIKLAQRILRDELDRIRRVFPYYLIMIIILYLGIFFVRSDILKVFLSLYLIIIGFFYFVRLDRELRKANYWIEYVFFISSEKERERKKKVPLKAALRETVSITRELENLWRVSSLFLFLFMALLALSQYMTLLR